jgi:hypothetical protein
MAWDINEGSDLTVAADEYGSAHNISPGEHVQFVALGTGTLGALALATPANPQPVRDGVDDVISVTPTIDTNIYAAGDAVGGKQTLASAVHAAGAAATLTTLTVVDKGNQKANLTILFFDSDPSAATITNNAAFVWSTDISKVIARVNVVTADYETIDSEAIATLNLADLGVMLEASGSTSLYAAVVLTSGTPTYTGTADLIFKYGLKKN